MNKFEKIYKGVQSIFSDIKPINKETSDPILFGASKVIEELGAELKGPLVMYKLCEIPDFNVMVYSVRDYMKTFDEEELETERPIPQSLNYKLMKGSDVYTVILIDEDATINKRDIDILYVLETLMFICTDVCWGGTYNSAQYIRLVASHLVGLTFLKMHETIITDEELVPLIERNFDLSIQEIDILTSIYRNDELVKWGNRCICTLSEIIGIDSPFVSKEIIEWVNRMNERNAKLREEKEADLARELELMKEEGTFEGDPDSIEGRKENNEEVSE